ncbi:hypothetical protein KVR01_007229 [Diaporthe batatas]|uniref:uncharacterized protein n=1 Tax=Diaporthe batatas TaxID=748121 RepID=UPI001D03E48D|nr:uncharacterized protein KVR01_007229 [Diaporthe batatas]KAG8162751.1 hypothetical protein KVR01_007229 [Diaporthe batatas]
MKWLSALSVQAFLAVVPELARASNYLPGTTWTICANSSTTCAQANVTFAYLYSYPFYPFALAVQGTPNATTNTLIHQRELVTAAQTWVVKPNVDTLYSRSFLDLSSSDLEVTIPEIDDRYWNYSAGVYLVQHDANRAAGVYKTNDSSHYQAVVNLPTPYAISIIRIAVKSQNNDTDLEIINSAQDRFNITVLPPRDCANPSAPALDLSMFSDPAVAPNAFQSLEEGILRLGAKLTRYNPAEEPADRAWVEETLTAAGFVNGTFVQPTGTNLTAAVQAANQSVTAQQTVPGFNINLGDQWTIKNNSYQADFHSAYFARYSVAAGGYLALTGDQVLYPVFSGSTRFNSSNEALLVTFPAKPTLADLGFWSLTVYDARGYLVPSDINVYALGDRSNLTMADGTKYADGGDGPFQVLIQPSDVVPPANWTTNWVPSPAGGAAFLMNLRFYGPESVLTDGTWVYPSVEKVTAFTA